LILTSYEALTAFAKQLGRHIAAEDANTKVVITPSSVKEKGLVIKVSALKVFLQSDPRKIRVSRMLRVRVSVAGSAESQTGLKQALGMIEALDNFFGQNNLRLEASASESVPNSRILQEISQEDSFFDSPDSTEVQDVQDDRIITITIPTGGN